MIKRIFLIFFVIAIGFAVYFSFPNLFHKNNIVLENYPKTLDTIQTIRKNLKIKVPTKKEMNSPI